MRSFTRQRGAFTLIELLIVVAIIGILAAIAVPNFLNARMRATIARMETDVKALGDALMMYRIDHRCYFEHQGGNPL
ncbi:MAG TPA: prepilin-type N-terminal cleavage/methylation domain-containing protein, partial [bacterium]|nr:prepilin-type N-terminal cleavage/methylation domain-containing protein [bacterium]